MLNTRRGIYANSKMSCWFSCLTSCCCSTILFVILGALAVLKLYLKWICGVCKSNKRLDGKTAIVTGANAGIGRETALDLARRRARVILACRDMEKANEARDDIIRKSGNKNVIVYKLNLNSLSSVREFAAEVIAKEERLDILVNNAGIGGSGPQRTDDGLNVGMQVNHFGPFLLTNLLLDLLKKSAPSRIVFVSSWLHKWAHFNVENLNCDKPISPQQVYNCSKLANVVTSNELARRLANTGVTVNSLHPGLVATEIFRKMPKYVLFFFNFVMNSFAKSATEGAQTTIYLAVSEEVEGVTGKYFQDCQEVEASEAAVDLRVGKRVWELSEKLVSLDVKKTK